ncbi:hypothetical protein EIP86_001372 [Pleurotus ostreatoroseus]|nr:hypothetical protein EIP86_001372 [Pleurotus ostreatoroseus]
MVIRARGLHLDFMLERIDSPRRREAAEFLITRVSSARSLAIWADEEDIARFILATAKHGPSRMLESLRLRCNLPDPLSTYSSSRRPVEPGCLPELDALLTATPNIRELELQCCTPNLAVSSERLRQLTSLTVDNSFVPYAQRSKVDIVALLKATPALTRLRINLALSPIATRYFTQSISAPTFGDPPYVELPRLVSLDLSDDLCLITDVLSILHIPSMRRLEIQNTDYCAPSLAALEALVSWSASWLHPSDNAPLHSISVNVPRNRSETSAQRVTLHVSAAERYLELRLRLKSTQAQGFFDDMKRYQLLPFTCNEDVVVPSKSPPTNGSSTRADW